MMTSMIPNSHVERTLTPPVALMAQTHTDPLLELLQYLSEAHYRFTTISPLSHQRIVARRIGESALSLRDIFGWSMPFTPSILPAELHALMADAGLLALDGLLLKSRVRVSSLDDDLFLHSAYPTSENAAVFFGPDTYRFVRFVHAALREFHLHTSSVTSTPRLVRPPVTILDMGCGTGAGGIAAARCFLKQDRAVNLHLSDINPIALRYAQANAALAEIPAEFIHSDVLSQVHGQFDLIIANPPYMFDEAGRSYRHGGDHLGRALSVRMVLESLDRLHHGGMLLLYTGVAIIDAQDLLLDELRPWLNAFDGTWSYSEIDPDVFGEELERPAYQHADRIAAVGLVIKRK
jgi:methylase of polypeptide subunit release factors